METKQPYTTATTETPEQKISRLEAEVAALKAQLSDKETHETLLVAALNSIRATLEMTMQAERSLYRGKP